MSVEQTTQLIQLILNSVLMSVACALILGGLIARNTALGSQIEALGDRSLDSRSTSLGSKMRSESLPGLSHRKRLKQLQHRYQLTRYSVLAAYYALLLSIFSCFTLTLRGILDWIWLIPVSLILFVIGIATLLLAVGLTLIDWHLGDLSLLDESRKLLSLGQDSPIQSHSRSRLLNGCDRKPGKSSRQRIKAG